MKTTKSMHGTAKASGCQHLSLGSFCKMFPDLSSWAEDFGIKSNAEAEEIAKILGGSNGVMHDADRSSKDSKIPAAYTFFAQFIDHDVTLDTTSNLHGGPISQDKLKKAGCPMHGKDHHDALPNLRSASLDLDCVYGFGPEASPHLYDNTEKGKLLVGNNTNPEDVPRNSDGTALIGDPRNDENIFVSQLQLQFLKFHNKRLLGRTFEEVQEDVKYHYQYLVFEDFLKRICHPDIYNFVISEIANNSYPKTNIIDDFGRICMPVEFSVAAYRFGHSMVRSLYPINSAHPSIELFDERFNTLGFSAVPKELIVDWSMLLDIESESDFSRSKSIDHLLADELIKLPKDVVDSPSELDHSLPFRNLLRSYALTLPSGQKVAEALKNCGYPIDLNNDLKLDGLFKESGVDNDTSDKLKDHTPLFLYILREAGTLGQGEKLGPIGSAILLEVFGTMLLHCDSYLTKDDWKPAESLMKDGDFTLASLIKYVTM